MRIYLYIQDRSRISHGISCIHVSFLCSRVVDQKANVLGKLLQNSVRPLKLTSPWEWVLFSFPLKNNFIYFLKQVNYYKSNNFNMSGVYYGKSEDNIML